MRCKKAVIILSLSCRANLCTTSGFEYVQLFDQMYCCSILTLQMIKVLLATVLPAKSDSDVMLCLQSYQGLIIVRSFVYRFNTHVIYRFTLTSSSAVYKLMFYLTIVNKILRTVTLGWHDSTCVHPVASSKSTSNYFGGYIDAKMKNVIFTCHNTHQKSYSPATIIRSAKIGNIKLKSGFRISCSVRRKLFEESTTTALTPNLLGISTFVGFLKSGGNSNSVTAM